MFVSVCLFVCLCMWDDLQCVSATCNHNEESETAGQKQKYESTGNLEGNGYYFSFDMCKKEKMLNERKRGCGGEADHRT